MSKLKTCATGTGVSLACCFGFLGFFLGLFGLTTALSYVNTYGDYVFFPSYAIFGTVFIYALLKWRKTWYNYLLSLGLISMMVYFSVFGIVYASLVIGGIIIGLIIIKYALKKKKMLRLEE